MIKEWQIVGLSLLLAQVAVTATEKPERLLQRARAAIGEEAILRQVKGLRLEGRIEPEASAQPEAELVMWMAKPAFQKLEVRMGEFTEATVSDGKRGQLNRQRKGGDSVHVRELCQAEVDCMRADTWRWLNFFEPEHPEQITLINRGIVRYRKQPCYKLVFKRDDAREQICYFSEADARHVATVEATGLEYHWQGVVVVGGLRFPSAVNTYQDGTLINRIVFTKIEVNPELPEGTFAFEAAPADDK